MASWNLKLMHLILRIWFIIQNATHLKQISPFISHGLEKVEKTHTHTHTFRQYTKCTKNSHTMQKFQSPKSSKTIKPPLTHLVGEFSPLQILFAPFILAQAQLAQVRWVRCKILFGADYHWCNKGDPMIQEKRSSSNKEHQNQQINHVVL